MEKLYKFYLVLFSYGYSSYCYWINCVLFSYLLGVYIFKKMIMKSNIIRSINKKTFIPRFAKECNDAWGMLCAFLGLFILFAIFDEIW